MSAVLIDTHVLAWSLIDPKSLPDVVVSTIEAASIVFVPPCALHEITMKVRGGKWEDMRAHADHLDNLCLAQGFEFAPYTARMAMASGSLDWPHRDPFDRMIAATSLELYCPLVSKDSAFDDLRALPSWPGRIWASS